VTAARASPSRRGVWGVSVNVFARPRAVSIYCSIVLPVCCRRSSPLLITAAGSPPGLSANAFARRAWFRQWAASETPLTTLSSSRSGPACRPNCSTARSERPGSSSAPPCSTTSRSSTTTTADHSAQIGDRSPSGFRGGRGALRPPDPETAGDREQVGSLHAQPAILIARSRGQPRSIRRSTSWMSTGAHASKVATPTGYPRATSRRSRQATTRDISSSRSAASQTNPAVSIGPHDRRSRFLEPSETIRSDCLGRAHLEIRQRGSASVADAQAPVSLLLSSSWREPSRSACSDRSPF
jgi:hypothetical protein